jgi:hypothetical protein
MLGWNIGVYQQPDGGEKPATLGTKGGLRLAVWQTGYTGLEWLDELAKADKAVDLGGNGYPTAYTAQAEILIPHILNGPADANKVWSMGESDSVLPWWVGRTLIDHDALRQCPSEEWLFVEAWDES